MALKLVPPLLVALALVGNAAADETCYTTSTTSEEMVVVELPPGILFEGPSYLVSDVCQDADDPEGGCLFSFWWYVESNGMPGLQRQDVVRDDVASCDGRVPADQPVS